MQDEDFLVTCSSETNIGWTADRIRHMAINFIGHKIKCTLVDIVVSYSSMNITNTLAYAFTRTSKHKRNQPASQPQAQINQLRHQRINLAQKKEGQDGKTAT